MFGILVGEHRPLVVIIVALLFVSLLIVALLIAIWVLVIAWAVLRVRLIGRVVIGIVMGLWVY